jgi:hypothetical protein
MIYKLNATKNDDNLIWDNITADILDLENTSCSLSVIADKLKTKNFLSKRGTHVLINSDVSKMLSDNYTYKNQKKIRINIFLAYILANHSIKNDRPSSHYCSYDQDFNELNKKEICNILNAFDI